MNLISEPNLNDRENLQSEAISFQQESDTGHTARNLIEIV